MNDVMIFTGILVVVGVLMVGFMVWPEVAWWWHMRPWYKKIRKENK